MKMRHITPLCLTVLLVLSLMPKLNSQNEVRVLSWNIRLDTQADGRFAWDFRKEKLVNAIREAQPDLLGLQEVLHPQLKFIESQLNEYEFAGVGRTDGKTGGEYSPVFYLKSRFKHISNGNFWLSEQPETPGSKGWDAAYERIVSWVRLYDLITNDTIWFFNTHFDHMGQIAQIQSAILLNQKINALVQSQNCILTGDFNVTPDKEPYQILTSGKNAFADARNIDNIDSQKQNHITYTGFDDLPQNDALIDFVFFKKPATSIFYEVKSVNPANFYLSDHLPVFAIIHIK